LANNIKQDRKPYFTHARSSCSSKAGVGPLRGEAGDVLEEPNDIAEELKKKLLFCLHS